MREVSSTESKSSAVVIAMLAEEVEVACTVVFLLLSRLLSAVVVLSL